MDRIDFIAFDIGGVLFNFNHGPAWVRTLPYCEISETLAYERFYNSGDMVESMIGDIDDDTFFRRLAEKLSFQKPVEDLRSIWSSTVEAMPQRIGMVRKLANHYRLGVISNISPFLSQQIDTYSDFTQHFERITYSWQARYVKPRPEIFAACLDGLDLHPRNCLFIDDQQRQTDAAAELGWQTLHLAPEDDLASKLLPFNIHTSIQ